MTRVALQIRRGSEVTTRAVDAFVFGDWCAHRSASVGVLGDDKWRVSHVPTGRNIISVVADTTQRTAIDVAKALDAAAIDLSGQDPDRPSRESGIRVREVVASVIHRDWPDWAVKAFVAGWRAPAGWTP